MKLTRWPAAMACLVWLAHTAGFEDTEQAVLNTRPVHADGHCFMYGICDPENRLSCLNYVEAPVGDPELVAEVEEYCALGLQTAWGGRTCVTWEHWHVVKGGFEAARPFLEPCPACWKNFRTLWCTLAVSPNQSRFVNVTRWEDHVVEQVDALDRRLIETRPVVAAIDYYVEPTLMQALFDSCVNVTFGVSNKKVLEILFSSDALKSAHAFFEWMGRSSPERSPYTIHFPAGPHNTAQLAAASIEPLAFAVEDCAEGVYRCSCVDCYGRCPPPEVWPTHSKYDCRVFGELYCWPAAFIFSYIVGLLVFLVVFVALRVWRYRTRPHMHKNAVGGLLGASDAEQGTPPCDGDDKEAWDESDETLRESLDADERKQAPLYRSFSYSVDYHLSRYFYHHGKFVARHSHAVIAATLALVLLAAASFLWNDFEIETDPINLWVGPHSQSVLEKAYFDAHFGPFYRIEHIIVSRTDPVSGERLPMVTRAGIGLVYDLMGGIQGLREPTSNVSLSDICFKSIGGECLIQAVSELWASRAAFEEDAYWEDNFLAWLKSPSENPLVLSSKKVPMMGEVILGGIALNTTSGRPFDSGSLSSLYGLYSSHTARETPLPIEPEEYLRAKALVVTLLVNNQVNKTTLLQSTIPWENTLLAYLKAYQQAHPEYTLVYSTENSVELEINRESNANIPIVMLSYAVMFIYACLALGRVRRRRRCFVDSRISLALSGIFIVLISILFSVTFFMAIHVKTTLIIAEVIPFLVLAVGIDNIFLLVHAYDRTSPAASVEERVGRALQLTGPSIVLTGLTELLAFSAGGFVAMPAVSAFSLYAAVAILCDFILQLTCFVAFLTIDGHRLAANRYDLLSFLTSPVPPDPIAPHRRWLESLIALYYAPFLLSRRVRPLLVALYLGGLCFSCAGMFYIELGLEQSLALPRDSYLGPYFHALKTDLLVGPPLYLVVRDLDVTRVDGQALLASKYFDDLATYNLGSIFEVNRHVPQSYLSSPLANWLDDYLGWAKNHCYRHKLTGAFSSTRLHPTNYVPCIDPAVRNLSDSTLVGATFMADLPYFLNKTVNKAAGCLPYGAIYGNAIHYASNATTVTASHFRTYFSVLRTQDDFISSLKAARKLCDDIKRRTLLENPAGLPLSYDIFPYSSYFIYFEQYLDIIPMSILLISVLLIAIFMSNWILLGSFRAALLVITMIASIVAGLLGMMGWWNIGLSAVSLVNIVIAIGISVEFCSNMARAYMIRVGSRQVRVRSTLIDTGSSVFSGITMTKFLGVVVLLFSNSKIFEIFYFRMYFCAVFLGAFHGLVMLPVFLSYFGPRRAHISAALHDQKAKESAMDNASPVLSSESRTGAPGDD